MLCSKKTAWTALLSCCWRDLPMCCPFGSGTVRKVWLEILLGTIKDRFWVVTSRSSSKTPGPSPLPSQMLLVLSSFLQASGQLASCKYESFPTLWLEEKQGWEMFSCSAPELTALPFCHSKYFAAFHHDQLQGLLLKQNHVGITWLLSVLLLLRVFLLTAREMSSVIVVS